MFRCKCGLLRKALKVCLACGVNAAPVLPALADEWGHVVPTGEHPGVNAAPVLPALAEEPPPAFAMSEEPRDGKHEKHSHDHAEEASVVDTLPVLAQTEVRPVTAFWLDDESSQTPITGRPMSYSRFQPPPEY